MKACRLAFDALSGWTADDHAAALGAYAATSDLLDEDWPRAGGTSARAFFERNFTPVLLGDPPALLTGYYEPEVEGVLSPIGDFRHPLHAMPDDIGDAPWFVRSEILGSDLLAGKELVWLSSAIEAFLAQVQGSVRVRLPDGSVRRFGFAGRNGHPYRSIGAELVRRGEISESAMSAEAIRAWCATHPESVAELLNHNPSYVFFRPLDLSEDSGPPGATGRPVTPGRSLAVDPEHIPLGAPVWVEADGIRSLMIAQDTGSAIRGPQRGDIFCGSGEAAGRRAGSMRLRGRMVVLLPHARAARLSP
ncbi:MAG: murein transglycosylase A [Albidovulum sp.]